MANRYPADIYALVVSELICEHFDGQTSLYPEKIDIDSALTVGVEPYELVNHLTQNPSVSDSVNVTLSKVDQTAVVDMMISESRLIINEDFEIKRIRSSFPEEVLSRINGWRNQYRMTNKNYVVRYISVNILGENIECETSITAQNHYDAAFLFGRSFADDNCLITEIMEVVKHH